jgi:hypothetical protein
LRPLVARGCQAFLSLNIFNNEVENPVLATRIYLVLLSISFSFILLLAGLGQQTHSYTVALPSESAFETLYMRYSTHDLSCPCSQSSVQYGTFASVSAVYHQVCSSGFVSFNWWTLVSATGNTFTLKDQPLLSAYFRMLSSLCTLANQTVDNAARVFASNAFVSVETLARGSFESQIESSLNAFIKQTPVTFLRTLKFTSDTFRTNQLQHMFMSSWKVVFTTLAEDYIEATIPLSYNNDTCTCGTSLLSPCSWQLVFVLSNTTTITLPGFVGGCLPVDGLRQSTLECLFDPICLATLGTLLNSSMVPSPLNASVVTRYPHIATTFGSMIDQLFVEEWINVTNYSTYYQACSPHICRYTYVERHDALYMITSLLGFYGGLTVSLRFIVLHGLSVFRQIRQWRLERHRRTMRIVPSHQVD